MPHLTVGRLCCIALAAYFLLSPIYAVFNYQDYASSTPLFLRYVLVPGLIASTLVLIAAFAARRLVVYVAIYSLSVLVALFSFELLLTVRSIPLRFAMLGSLSKAELKAIEERKNTVRGFALNGLNRAAQTSHLSTALLSGFPGTNVILCTPGGEAVEYVADRYGFNNPDSLLDASQDVMVLGDSFVEGFCLPPGQDLVSQIRSTGISAVSVGIRGNGPMLELATLGRFISVIHPQTVVMVFFEGNDWENLENELAVPWLREALSPSARFGNQSDARHTMDLARIALNAKTERQVSILDVISGTELIRNFFALQQTFARLGLILPRAAKPVPEYASVLRRSREISAGNRANFILVYVPSVDRYLGPLSSDWAFDQLRQRVVGAAAEESVDVIDLGETLRKERSPASFYAADGHFNRAGAAYAAQAIAKRLSRKVKPNLEIVDVSRH